MSRNPFHVSVFERNEVRLQNASSRGYQAYLAGLKDYENPYQRKGFVAPLHHAWTEGWLRAAAERGESE